MKKLVLIIAVAFAFSAFAGEKQLRTCSSGDKTTVILNEENSGSIDATRSLILSIKGQTSRYTQLAEYSDSDGRTYEAAGSLHSPDIKVTFTKYDTAVLSTRKFRWVTKELNCK